MAVYFGLNISRNLTEIQNPSLALANLGLDVKDIDTIKGITDPGGVTRSDLKSLSDLNFDLEKTLTSLRSETSNYNNLSTNVYDEDSFLNSNLIISGQLAATAIKYLYVDYTDSNKIKAADISTSRVSSWSSFDVPVTSSSPIFYGGEVLVEGPLELSEIYTGELVEAVRFESEIPTHRIKANIAGEDVYLYAMKGIPLTFTGFFRNATISAYITSISGRRPSWVIKNTGNNLEYVYRNRLSGTLSTISFSDTSAKERNISFYYPVDNITRLELPSLGIVRFPEVVLTKIQTLNLSSNDFREFPDFSEFTSMINLNFYGNNTTRTQNADISSLNQNIIARLPTSLKTLVMGNCFSGTSTADFSGLALTTLNLDAGSTYNRRLSGVAPNVDGSVIITYNINSNAFSNLPASVKDSQTLRYLYISDNNISASDIYVSSPELIELNAWANRCNIIDVAGKTKLKTYTFSSGSSSIAGSSTITNIFNNCSALESITVRNTPVTGSIPEFVNCTSLKTIDFENTNITDAYYVSPLSEDNLVLTNTTFNSCRNTLSSFRITSSYFTRNGKFERDCFADMTALSYFLITSNKRGISGELPSFSTARNLQYVLIYNNFMTGLVEGVFNNCEKLFFLNLTNNSFTGAVPNIPTSTLGHLILPYNRFDNFPTMSAINLIRIHLSFNKIPLIPNLSNLTKLQELLINNQSPAAPATSVEYYPGSFEGLVAIRTINASNNNMSQGTIDRIIKDLDTNYTANPRSGVSINLKGNSAPTATGETSAIIKKLRGAGWTILTS